MATLAQPETLDSQITARISKPLTFRLPEGRMIYEDSQEGSRVVVCIPGTGDTRGQFRELAPLLSTLGFRVIVIDPRGEGTSDGTFSDYKASSVGADIIRFLDSLGTTAVLIGNSSGGASATWAAAERPDLVDSIILLDGVLRDRPMSWFGKLKLHLGLASRLWAPLFWTTYYKTLYKVRPPQDLSAYTRALRASLRLPGHLDAVRKMMYTTKSDVEARASSVRKPVLAIVGSKDPEFANPREELRWIENTMRASTYVVEGAGHFPHLEQPQQVVTRIGEFLGAL